jgi:hypothetical protein
MIRPARTEAPVAGRHYSEFAADVRGRGCTTHFLVRKMAFGGVWRRYERLPVWAIFGLGHLLPSYQAKLRWAIGSKVSGSFG